MRAYVMTTGAIFGLLTVAHIWRWYLERHLLTDVWHVTVTVLAAALTVWAWRVTRRTSQS